MELLLTYNASGAATCFCCYHKVIAVYPNKAVIPTSVRMERFPLYIQDGTVKLIEKPT